MTLRIGLLFQGDRAAGPAATERAARLQGLTQALQARGATVEPVVYQEAATEEVRRQLLGLDGVLVWVNPIQDGVNREHLDHLLRQVRREGVWVSADPAVILALGTKEILYRTRDVGWGSGTECYTHRVDFRDRFPGILARDRVRVLKQARGNGGNGVWKVELVTAGPAGPDALVRVQHAMKRADTAHEELALRAFLDRCDDYFAWSGALVDQPFCGRLSDGMVRCYLVHDRVAGFCHQWPKALLDPASPEARTETPDAAFTGPDDHRYQRLRRQMESEWMPKTKAALGLSTDELPAIWDADFLYGPKNAVGEDTYVLCEINVSAVWPFPEQAVEMMADAVFARIGAPGTP